MKRTLFHLENESKRGVALIVVLGFLSIMIVMAVAFLTQARMERLVSDATMEGQRGRQLLRTALHAAMNDYSVALSAAQLVMPVKPEQELFVSFPPTALSGISGGKIGKDGISLLVGEVSDWIPRKYTNDPYLALATVTNDAEWILVREDPSTQSRILGRYAYACFDMSGGMDANLIARVDEVAKNDGRVASNRVRRSVRQVPMGLLPEAVNASQFKSYRKGWKGFDSLYALIHLTDGNAEDGNGEATRWDPSRKEIYGAGLASNKVSDLTPFSLSAFRGGQFQQGPNKWTPYVLVNESTVWSTVLNPISSQFGSGWNTWIGDAIHDYTHADKIPKGTDYPSPKNVPMFNEIDATFEVEETSAGEGLANYTLKLNLTFEFWYPFPSTDNNGGSFRVEAPTVGGGPATTGPNQLWFRVLPVVSGTEPLVLRLGTASPSPSTLTVDAKYNGGIPYVATGGSTNFVYEIPFVNNTGVGPLPSGLTMQLQQGFSLMQPIYLTSGGANADMIPKGLSFSGAALANGQKITKTKAVTDPRLNHLTGEWVEESSSPGKMNTWDASLKAKFLAEGTNFYCRNAPMETPAELGFISTGKAWETIDLCTVDAANMLAPLVTDSNLFLTWNSNQVFYTNGTINPNTRSSNVLASVFYDLSTHEVPGVGTSLIPANPIDESTAQFIAARIMDETTNGTISTVFHAGSDWARIPGMRKNGALAAMGLNNNQRESLIRNTWGLFSPDNSLFTVVVVAQTIKEGPTAVGIWGGDDLVTGERRAVALVWRDPFKTGQNLHHEMLVRMFRYLND